VKEIRPGLDAALAPNLRELVDGNSFVEVLNNYRRLFDLPFRVFDVEGNLLAETAATLPVCRAFGQSETGKKRCIAVRMKIKKAVPEEKRLLSVDCLCGLRYTAAPISFQGKVLGKLVIGPYRPAQQDSASHGSLLSGEDVDFREIESLLQAVRQTPMTLLRKIASAVLSVLDAILFSAHKALVTSEMHIATVRESVNTLNEKNRQLEEMNDRMKEFDRMKSSFLSTVSHELRTPLTSIIGYSDMLASGIAGALDEEQQRFIDTIKTKGEELLRLISAILDFSQIETGHLTLDAEPVAPGALLEDIVRECRENAEKRGVRLSVNLSENLRRVSLDVAKIRSATVHLIDNAVKFSPVGGVVRVSAEIVAAQGEDMSEDGFGFVLLGTPDWLEISVQDFGEGIADEDQNVIFEPFTQLDDSTTREHGGAGLGLALVKQFISAHNGKVEVHSTPNEGSRFVIRVPASAA
jgi:two-component system, NarL family, sensor histidine kinase BarA